MAQYNEANGSFLASNRTVFEAVVIANSSGSILNSFGGGSNSAGSLGQNTAAGSLGVVLNSDPDIRPAAANITIVDSGSTPTTSQSNSILYTGNPTAGSYVMQTVNGQSTWGVELSSLVGTVQFENSFDSGTTWVPVTMRVRGSSFTTSTATANGAFTGEIASATNVRVRATAAITGNTVVRMNFSQQPGMIQVLNPIKVYDNVTGQAVSVKAAGLGANTTDTSLVVTLNTGNNTIGSVSGLSSGAAVEVVPTVNSTATYANVNIMGGIMTFSNILPLVTFNGILESLTLKFKNTVQTGQYQVALFTASPTGTFNDKAVAAIANTDAALLTGIFTLSNALSSLGTHTIYNLDGIGKQIVGSSNSLYAVVVATNGTTVNCTSTSDMSLRIGMIW